MLKTLDIEHNFLAIEDKYSNLKDSEIVIVSAPYEHTTSYGKGSQYGPQAILDASAYVEFYDDEFDRELCFEKGIATLEPIDFQDKVDEDALDIIENQVDELLDLDKFVVTLGGEHTISVAPIRSHYVKYEEISILHFDAHSDLRDSFEGSKYSHASFMARVCDFFPDILISQVGIRALCKEEAEFIKQSNIHTFFASEIRRNVYGKNWQKELVNTLIDKIYITFDVDFFDPAIMPATGTPEPDGFLYSETLDIFREIIHSGRQIIGFDIVELAPMNNISFPDLTTARLLYKLLNFAFYNKY